MSEPNTPIDAYKAIIDQLVMETRLLGPSSHVVENGFFSKAPAHKKFNEYIRSLSMKQKKLLSEMLRTERDGTIHDVLAVLTWWIICRQVGLTFRGLPMPVDISGAGLHGDYVGRREGWDWPTEQAPLTSPFTASPKP
jgi:hypothetical protein